MHLRVLRSQTKKKNVAELSVGRVPRAAGTISPVPLEPREDTASPGLPEAECEHPQHRAKPTPQPLGYRLLAKKPSTCCLLRETGLPPCIQPAAAEARRVG